MSQACGCQGGAAAAIDCQDEGFSRPRFFGGQLLTEEDLGALGDYVVGKNRLHNRHLFGSGVVCGLQVTCTACGGSRVQVAGGYAIDGCGNDLYLPCPTTVDIKKLLRDLKRTTLGSDCGEPCDAEGRVQRYDLYAVYTETGSQPVSPYAAAEPCGQAACESSRVVEGLRFELRCPQEEEPTPDMLSRLLDCLGDLSAIGQIGERARAVQETGKRQKQVAEVYQLAAQDQQAYQERLAISLNEAHDLQRRADEVLQLEEKSWSAEEADRVADHLASIAAIEARYLLAGSQDGSEAIDSIMLTQNQPERRQALVRLSGELRGRLPEAEGQRLTYLQRYGEVDLLQDFFGRDGQQLKSSAGAPLSAAQTEQAQVYLLAVQAGAPATPAIKAEETSNLERLHEALQRLVDRRPPFTDCRLRQDIARFQVPQVSYEEQTTNPEDTVYYPETGGGYQVRSRYTATASEYRALGEGSDELVRLLLRYLLDCLCHALLPSCPEPRPGGVRLARLGIDDCQVWEICNLARSYVLSPMAMRYWVAPLTWLGNLLQTVCCDLRGRLIEPQGMKKLAARYGRELHEQESMLIGLAEQVLAPHSQQVGGLRGLKDVGRSFAVVADLAAGLVDASPVRVKLFAGQRQERSATAHFDASGGKELGQLKKMFALRSGREEVHALVEDPRMRVELREMASATVAQAIDDGRLDVAPLVERAAAAQVDRLRGERDAAIKRALGQAAADGSLAEAIAPAVDRRLEQERQALPAMVTARVDEAVRSQGLDAESIDRRLSAKVSSALASGGLSGEALNERLKAEVATALVEEGVTREAMDARIDRGVANAIDQQALTTGQLADRIDRAVQGELAKRGLSETAISERLASAISGHLAAHGLSESALDERVAAAVERRMVTGSGTAASPEEMEELRQKVAELEGRVARAGATSSGDDETAGTELQTMKAEVEELRELIDKRYRSNYDRYYRLNEKMKERDSDA